MRKTYSLETLANFSDAELDAMADAGTIDYGDIIAGKLERQVRGQREAAMLALISGDAGFDEQRENYLDRVCRLAARVQAADHGKIV